MRVDCWEEDSVGVMLGCQKPLSDPFRDVCSKYFLTLGKNIRFATHLWNHEEVGTFWYSCYHF